MSTSVGILPMILRWGCGVPVAATSRESYARNTGLVGSGKGVKGLALAGDRVVLKGCFALADTDSFTVNLKAPPRARKMRSSSGVLKGFCSIDGVLLVGARGRPH